MAEEVGAAVAEAGAVLVCGGLGGVMEAACRGARSAGRRRWGCCPLRPGGRQRLGPDRGADRARRGPQRARRPLRRCARRRRRRLQEDQRGALGRARGSVIGLGAWELARGGRPGRGSWRWRTRARRSRKRWARGGVRRRRSRRRQRSEPRAVTLPRVPPLAAGGPRPARRRPRPARRRPRPARRGPRPARRLSSYDSTSAFGRQARRDRLLRHEHFTKPRRSVPAAPIGSAAWSPFPRGAS